MNIIGIDPAARKLAIWCGGVDFVFEKLPLEDQEACFKAYRTLCDVLFDRYENAVIYMEKSISRGNPHATIVQAHGVGALLAAAGEFRVEVRRVDNMTWKKRLVGNARAEKDEIAEWVRKNHPDTYGACAGNQDLIDAFCIYEYGRKNHPLIEKARELSAKVEGKKARKRVA